MQPYLVFYTEGRGYDCYCRMPFGLTGAPTNFGDMAAITLRDLIGLLFKLYVDDTGMAGDKFEDKLTHLRKFFERVRAMRLSLSPSKTQLFMTEIGFAGARVGWDGIKPDLSKLSAIVNWEIPNAIHNLMQFLGLTGYFRSLIKDYARKAAPLTDLVRRLGTPPGGQQVGRYRYRQHLQTTMLKPHWGPRHTETFMELKTILVSEPVLKGPRFDGTPFVVTTDGCQEGFGVVLTQKHTSTLPSGRVITAAHPITFASKCTSLTEEKYKPYILEFAALKLALDQFSDIIWGSPVEIETDCQALRDTLLSPKLSIAHARWRDGILAYHIIDVRHRPGSTNTAADGLSRSFISREPIAEDGANWTVNEDWESSRGTVQDLFQVALSPLTTSTDNPSTETLHQRFEKEPLFLEVIDAIHDLDSEKSVVDK